MLNTAPSIVCKFPSRELEALAQKSLTDIFGSEMILFKQCGLLENVLALLHPLNIIDYKILKEKLLQYALKLYGGSKQMNALSSPIVEGHYKKLFFSEEEVAGLLRLEEYEKAELRNNERIHPMMIVIVNNNLEKILPFLELHKERGIFYNLASESATTIIGILFASTEISPSEIREVVGDNEITYSLSPIPQYKLVLPSTMNKLSFSRQEYEQIKKINDNNIKAQLDELPQNMIGPNLIVKCESHQQFIDVSNSLSNMYDNMLIIKTTEYHEEYYVSVLFNVERIKYSTFWYCIDKDIKRFVELTPINYPPKICPIQAFENLLFTREEYNQVYDDKEVLEMNNFKDKRMVGPKMIFVFENKRDLTSFRNKFEERFTASHVHVSSFETQSGLQYLGLLYDESMLESRTLNEYFSDKYEYCFSKEPMTEPPNFMSKEIFEKLMFPYAIYHSLEELGAFLLEKQNKQESAEHPSFQNSLALNNPTICFIDFEAYFYTQDEEYPSEIGIVIVQDEQILMTIHSFFIYDADWYHNLQPSKEKIADKVISLTQIPLSHEEAYQYLSPKCQNTDLAQLLVDLRALSSTELLNKYCNEFEIKVQVPYSQLNEELVFSAKGVQLERLIFSKVLGLSEEIIEYVKLAKQTCSKPSLDFKDIHSSIRQYNYCQHHARIEQCASDNKVHCALDDSLYIANKFIDNFESWRKEEMQVEQGSEALFSESEIPFEAYQIGEHGTITCKADGDKQVIEAIFNELQVIYPSINIMSPEESILEFSGEIEPLTVRAYFPREVRLSFISNE